MKKLTFVKIMLCVAVMLLGLGLNIENVKAASNSKISGMGNQITLSKSKLSLKESVMLQRK